jgi:predicted TPR repeat methyltransferase
MPGSRQRSRPTWSCDRHLPDAIEVFLHHHSGEQNDLEVAARQAFIETLELDPPEAAYAVAVIRSVGKAAASEQLSRAAVLDWADRTATLLADHMQLV